MRGPRLEELPAPPAGRTGWPWSVETPPCDDLMHGGADWPLISVVVASLNQGRYIEEMLRSVLLQGYPRLELIVIDGASGPETLDVIERYASWIAYHVSEPDRGQSHAFNKGLERAGGGLFNLFSTDDLFLPASFARVAAAHMRQPAHILACDVIFAREGEDRHEVHRPEALDLHAYAQWWKLPHHAQPGIFFPRERLAAVGPVDEQLHYSMDYEFMLRFLAHAPMAVLRAPVALSRIHAECKSVKNGDYCVWECMQIVKTYQRRFPDIAAEADRQAAGILFGFGLRRLLCRQGDAWRFMREGLKRHPLRALHWLFPGWFLRKWSQLKGGAAGTSA